MGRFRPLHKARLVAQEGVRFRDAPRDVVRFVLFDPELHSYTYDLANQGDLIELAAAVTGTNPDMSETYLREAEADRELGELLSRRTRWRIDAKRRMPLGNRLLWYVLTRHAKPELVVETGIFNGLGSLVVLRALERNAEEGVDGRLLSIDIDPTTGWLVPRRLSARWERVTGDILSELPRVLEGRRVDMWIHDSVHTAEFQELEFRLALDHMQDRLLILDESGDGVGVLRAIAAERGTDWRLFVPRPLRHFYRHPGTAVAWFRPGGAA
jgi:hypothetical protein